MIFGSENLLIIETPTECSSETTQMLPTQMMPPERSAHMFTQNVLCSAQMFCKCSAQMFCRHSHPFLTRLFAGRRHHRAVVVAAVTWLQSPTKALHAARL